MFRPNIVKKTVDQSSLNILKKLSPAPAGLPSSPYLNLQMMHRVLLCTMKEHTEEQETQKKAGAPWHNYLTPDLVRGMCELLVKAEENINIQGIIFRAERHGKTGTSDQDKNVESNAVFSQGIDCQWLLKTNTETFEDFWFHLQELWIIMQLMQKPLIACVEGNAVGMGCTLALACDCRVGKIRKAEKVGSNTSNTPISSEKEWKIGLNELRYGFISPPWVTAALGYTIGYRQAEKLIRTGALITPRHAHTVGLFDVLTPNDALYASLVHMHNLLSIPCHGHQTAKSMLRRELLSPLLTADYRVHDITYFSTYRRSKDFREALREYLDNVDERTGLLLSESRPDSWDPQSPESMGETVTGEKASDISIGKKVEGC